VETIEEHGFAIISDAVSGEDISKLSQSISDVHLSRSRAGVRHALKYPAVAQMARHPGLLVLARNILGCGALPFRATLFDKSPESNWLVVWHQDTALPLRAKRDAQDWGPWSVKDGVIYAHAPARVLARVLALRLHLDDSTAENGPLRVLPGSHKMGVLDDDAIHELAERTIPIDCLVPRGGVLAMRPLTVHASSKSQTDLPRRVLHIEYTVSMRIEEYNLELAVA
jgi:hypothetical protein